jgi:hypothetical protein
MRNRTSTPRRDAFIHTARTPPRRCPACRVVLNAATGVSLDPADAHPEIKIGDVTACAECEAVLVVTTIGFRVATDADLAALDPTLRRLVTEYPGTRRAPRRPR